MLEGALASTSCQLDHFSLRRSWPRDHLRRLHTSPEIRDRGREGRSGCWRGRCRRCAGLLREQGLVHEDIIKSWASLAPNIQGFVFDQVKATAGVTADQLWQPALKIAADAAGATDGIIRHGGLAFVNRAGLGIDTDVIVLSTPEIAGMPYVIAGLVAAGGLAAALSTADGLLLAIANALSHDIYYKMLDPRAPTSRRLIVSRILLVTRGDRGRLCRFDQAFGHSGDGVMGVLAGRRRHIPRTGARNMVGAPTDGAVSPA